jgi:hypothetical protein
MFNTLTLTLNQVWHHVIITNCHSIHHKHCKRLSKTIKLTKWCHTNQNGQFYIKSCNRWVQYSWLAEPNNPSSITTWEFHCRFHITRAAYTSKYSQSKIHQQLHNYDISVLQMYTTITVPHFIHTVHGSTTLRTHLYDAPKEHFTFWQSSNGR